MLRDALAHLVTSAVHRLIEAGELPEAVSSVPVEVLDTKQPEHGDYATNFALVASKIAGINPRALAEKLVTDLSQRATPNSQSLIDSVEIAGPGFLNLRLNPAAVATYIPEIIAQSNRFGNAKVQSLKSKVNVEFVSVNPNGPITVGSGRGAAFGDTLCRVLEAAGHQVHREYYVNDGVNSEQMRLFAESIRAEVEKKLNLVTHRLETAYRGQYVEEEAERIIGYLDLARYLANNSFRKRVVQILCEEKGVDTDTLINAAELVRATITRRAIFGYDPRWVSDEDPSWNPFDYSEPSEREKHIFDEVEFLALETLPDSAQHWTKNLLLAWYFSALIVLMRGDDFRERVDLLSEWTSHPHAIIRDADSAIRQIVSEGASKITSTLPPSAFTELHDPVAEEVVRHLVWGFWIFSDEEIMGDDKELIMALRRDEDLGIYREISKRAMLHRQKEALSLFGVDFKTWFSEQSLHESGEVAKCIDELTAKGAADEEPYRTVLKLGKGGVVEEAKREEQPGEEDEGDGGDTAHKPQPTGNTLWLRSTKFGDDMDRVLRRRDGRLTYIASDVAYHKDKLTDGSGTRGTGPVDKLITILGPDHHGYIARLQAVVAALLEGAAPSARSEAQSSLSGTDLLVYRSAEEKAACLAALEEAKQKLEVVIFQIVRFVKDGKPAPMRKRDGNIYELRDLITELGAAVAASATKEEQQRIGADVARFFYLMRSHDTHMDFDIDLATKQSDENPVFYVQYAHARICSVLRKAQDSDRNQPNTEHRTPNTSLLSHPREQALIRKILDLPWEVQRCAEDYGVHRLTTYAIELARAYHHFYDACRVILADQPDLTQARLALCQAARIALRATLDLCGVSAPERMDRAEATQA